MHKKFTTFFHNYLNVLEHQLFPQLPSLNDGLFISLNSVSISQLLGLRFSFEKLMSNYLNWLINRDYNRAEEIDYEIPENIINALRNYTRGIPPLQCGETSELKIDHSSLIRSIFLPYKLIKYQRQSLFKNVKNITLIREYTYLTNRHFREVVAMGVYQNIIYRFLLSLRNKTSYSYKNLLRSAINEALDYYVTTFDHYAEVRFFPLLKFKSKQKIYLEDYAFNSLLVSNSVVDFLQLTIWFAFQNLPLKQIKKAENPVKYAYLLAQTIRYFKN